MNMRRVVVIALLAASCGLLLLAPDAFAAGNSIGQKVGSLLKGYAADLYGGLAGVTSLMFLWNRRYTELATFLVAAIVVGWLVFAAGSVGVAAESIAKQIFG
jgi:hypothetical protein